MSVRPAARVPADDGGEDEAGVPGCGEFDRAWREHAAERAAAARGKLAAAREEGQQQQEQAEAEEKEPPPPPRPWETPEGQRAVTALEGMGAKVYLPGVRRTAAAARLPVGRLSVRLVARAPCGRDSHSQATKAALVCRS